jgi:hypothetical protein
MGIYSSRVLRNSMDHKTIDKRSLELHKMVVQKMERHPDKVIHAALENISRWQKIPDIPENLLLKWKNILIHKKCCEIKKLLLSRSDESQQLRQSTPFCGILSEKERMKIFRKYSHR